MHTSNCWVIAVQSVASSRSVRAVEDLGYSRHLMCAHCERAAVFKKQNFCNFRMKTLCHRDEGSLSF